MLQQGLFPDVSHPWDAVQSGGQGGFRVLFVVIGDGEAVDLLLHPAHQGKQRGALLDAQLLPLGRYQGPGPVAVIFYHAQHRHGEAQPFQHMAGGLRLQLAAVHQQQVRQGGKVLVSLQIPPEPALQHLLHGPQVVGVVQSLYLEPAIVPLQGPSVREHHHGGHHVLPGGVGNIVGFQPPGGLRQPGQGSQLL